LNLWGICNFAGATLGKGLNRALATLVAGTLGVGTHHLASLCGKIGEPVLIGSFVFLLGKFHNPCFLNELFLQIH